MASKYNNTCNSIENSTFSESRIVKALKSPNEVQFQELREEYHRISENLRELTDEAGKAGCSAESLNVHVLSKLDRTFEKVQRPPEARLDAQILKQVSLLGKANIEKTQSSFLAFNPSEYAVNLVSFMNNGESLVEFFEPNSTSLTRLSEAMSCLYHSTYGLEPLYGGFEWEFFENRPRRNDQVGKDQPNKLMKKSIEKLKDGTTNEEDQLEEVTRVFNILKRKFEEKRQAIPLLEFIIDPTCFSTTVQNLFHTSFLMRDNFVELTFNEHKIPCLMPIHKKEREIRRTSPLYQNNHAVLEMNMDLWQECITLIGIEEAMIPKVKRNDRHFQ